MREKTADFFYALCISLGGMSIAFLYPTDIAVAIVVTIICAVVGILLVFLDTDRRKMDYLSVGALFSSAVSLYLGVTFVTDFTLDNSFIPICLFLSGVVAALIAFSSSRASKSVACVMSVLAIVLLLIVFLLCVLESDFSVAVTFENDKRILLPLTVFSVLDLVFIMPYVKKKNRIACVFGSIIMPVYLLATIIVTIFVLPNNISFLPVPPIIKMWQSCFVLSFIDRFETLIICVLFALNVIKAGVLLKTSLCKIKKQLVFIPVLLALALVIKPALIYVFALLTLIFVSVYLLFKKTY